MLNVNFLLLMGGVRSGKCKVVLIFCDLIFIGGSLRDASAGDGNGLE